MLEEKSVLTQHGGESFLLSEDSAMTFATDGDDIETTRDESKTHMGSNAPDPHRASLSASVKTEKKDEHALLKGVKGCGGLLDSTREAIEAVEASMSITSVSSEAETIKDTEQSVVSETDMEVHGTNNAALSTYFSSSYILSSTWPFSVAWQMDPLSTLFEAQ